MPDPYDLDNYARQGRRLYLRRRWGWRLLVLALLAGEYAWLYWLSPAALAWRVEVSRLMSR